MDDALHSSLIERVVLDRTHLHKCLLRSCVIVEKVPIFEPGNSGFKNGNLSFILGSRKELRFVLNRSFHVQLSMRSVTVVKFDILF